MVDGSLLIHRTVCFSPRSHPSWGGSPKESGDVEEDSSLMPTGSCQVRPEWENLGGVWTKERKRHCGNTSCLQKFVLVLCFEFLEESTQGKAVVVNSRHDLESEHGFKFRLLLAFSRLR